MQISFDITSLFSVCIGVLDLLEEFSDVALVIFLSLYDLATNSAVLLLVKSPVASAVSLAVPRRF